MRTTGTSRTFAALVMAAAMTMAALSASSAAAAGPPLQATIELNVGAAAGDTVSRTATLEGGDARLKMRIVNRADLRTATVILRFRYDIPPDTIALDEIVDRIVIETSSADAGRTGRIEIDPNEVNLNSNGPRLSYTLTIYRPEGSYNAELKVFGNYE